MSVRGGGPLLEGVSPENSEGGGPLGMAGPGFASLTPYVLGHTLGSCFRVHQGLSCENLRDSTGRARLCLQG